MRGRLAIVLLCCAASAGAQVYKWVDAKGVTHYGDTAPPGARAELKGYNVGSAEPALPPPLAEAVRKHPVTLYTTVQCEPCAHGRAMLLARGIPFSEKTVSTPEDHAALRQAGSNGQLPLLLVGRGKQLGYSQDSWDMLLSEAGYPLEKQLPPGYQLPPASAAAAPFQSGPKANPDTQQPRRVGPPLDGPPGFQF